MEQHVVWDGVEERVVSAEEAQRLEKEDKAQDMTSKALSGHEYKTREQFGGYQTREMRAGGSANWRSYKKAAAEWLGDVDVRKVTKAQVEEYLEAHGITAE